MCYVSHSLALDVAGRLYCWGNDAGGLVKDFPSDECFLRAAAGYSHSVALREANGQLYSWGSNLHGQVSSTPGGAGFAGISSPSAYAPVCALAAGKEFSLAVLADGRLIGWGYDGAAKVLSDAPASLISHKLQMIQ